MVHRFPALHSITVWNSVANDFWQNVAEKIGWVMVPSGTGPAFNGDDEVRHGDQLFFRPIQSPETNQKN
jgi:hypothetical protein